MKSARASHILVSSEELCNQLKARIEGGESFAAIAGEFST